MKDESVPTIAEPKAPRGKVVMLATMSDDEHLDHFVRTEVLPTLAVKPISTKELHQRFSEWWMHRLPGTETPSQRKLAQRMKAAGLRSVKQSGIIGYGAELAAAA